VAFSDFRSDWLVVALVFATGMPRESYYALFGAFSECNSNFRVKSQEPFAVLKIAQIPNILVRIGVTSI
jgi:hypothetical protein